ncbi:TetR family transcriptional regulator [Baekduia soli]|uniref:TetR family transcriptional regulator n=1 Tax=Baekduia soli TaxID=496014 RepID=A0A5B8UA41_9ACTN|nr:TetR family transcriptional regulator [Baekduia soli]QEC50063.1 TetR family transcriptional regulator [Baekduia soli]
MAAEPSPSPGRPRGRPSPRGARRRTELLEAAIGLIGAHGLEAVTHRAVAAAAGVPAASTSYHFASKDDLILQALRLLAEREIGRLRARRAVLGAGAADLEATTEALAAWIEEQIATESVALLAQYQLQLEAARDPSARAILEAWKEGTDDLAQTAMRSLGARDVENAAVLLVCAIDGLRLRLLASAHAPLSGPQLREALALLLRGLAR